jgi:hypothetical protein
MMTRTQATAEIFLTAFYALSKPDQTTVVKRLLEDQEFGEDLMDIAILEQRRQEPSRPLTEYLATRKHR